MNKKKIIVFGIGNNYFKNKEFLQNRYNVIALCDNSLDKQGNTTDGFKCISPADILTFDFDKIIILPNDFSSIYKQLLQLGIPENKIDTILDSVCLEACALCQLNCKTCYMRKNNAVTVGKGYLTFSNFKNFLLNNMFIKNIELSNNGEIFLNPDLIHIIKYAFENKVSLTANNGVNFNSVSDDVLEALEKFKFKNMTISIDGVTQETYSEYRKNGNVNTVLNNIKRLNYFKIKHNMKFPKLRWQYIIMEHNENDVIKAKRIAKELGMEIYFKLTWDRDYIPKNTEMLKKETGLKWLTREEVPKKGNVLPYADCYQLFKNPQINWDGRLLGCCCAAYSDFGINVFEVGLEKACNSENYSIAKKMVLGEIDAPKNAKNIPCVNCTIYKTMKKENLYLGIHKECKI